MRWLLRMMRAADSASCSSRWPRRSSTAAAMLIAASGLRRSCPRMPMNISRNSATARSSRSLLLCALLGRVSLVRQLLRPNRRADHLLVRFALVDDQRIGVSPFAGQIRVGGFALAARKSCGWRLCSARSCSSTASALDRSSSRRPSARVRSRSELPSVAVGCGPRSRSDSSRAVMHDLVGTLAGDPHHLVCHSFDDLALFRDGGVGLVPFDPQALVGLVAVPAVGAAYAVGGGIGQLREHFDRLAEHGQVTDRLLVQLDGDALLRHYAFAVVMRVLLVGRHHLPISRPRGVPVRRP